MEIREGQEWRNANVPGEYAQIITVEGIAEGDALGTYVHGSYREAGLASLVGADVWPLDEFARMTLLSDPQWPVHRVSIRTRYSEAITRAMMHVGTLEGYRSHSFEVGEPWPQPLQWWDVVAPSAELAIDRVEAAVQALGVDEGLIRVNPSFGRRRRF